MSELEYWKKLAKSRERLYSSQLNILAKSHKQALREQLKKIDVWVDKHVYEDASEDLSLFYMRFKQILEEEMGVR